MKSEVEQFNKLQFPPPLSSFGQIPFFLSENRAHLNYYEAHKISEESLKYFDCTNFVSNDAIRARFKGEKAASFKNCEMSPYIEIEQDISNSAALTNPSDETKLSYYRKLVGGFLRRREYLQVISTISKVHHLIQFGGILPICLFIAAILEDDDSSEFNFFKIIEEQTIFDMKDTPHFLHLLDELKLIQADKYYPAPLLELIIPDTDLLRKIIRKRCHIIPKLRSVKYYHIQDQMFNMTHICNNAKDKLPQLLPIGEGFLGITIEPKPLPPSFSNKPRSKATKTRARTPAKTKESADVLALISQKKWDNAIALATEALNKNPNDSEMYLHRAFALYNEQKIEDAINDCTTSLSVKKTDKALRMRAAFWRVLEEIDLCLEDLQMMDDKASQQKFLNGDSNKRGQITLSRGKNQK